ncbi:hypothetical protein [Sediminispirochaeta bajacaliforniensis]|uniref:hypothetical protein n=1 Tax=Sediminispirochaeta bajacaliforniensis TaxID=148 RepID=UPI00036246E1|nr:hypothetical protein [Sediminispirochaeta bajacaliforniensis]
MSASDYIIKCSITPPQLVYIHERTLDNEFCIEFEKVPVAYGHNDAEAIKDTSFIKEERSGAAIYIKLGLGDEIDDLCTAELAAQLSFTTLEGDGWEMEWSAINKCFIIYPPDDFNFPDSYRASFRSNGFYTEAKEGAATLEAYVVNFPDVSTKIVAVNIYKRYPIAFDYFRAEPEPVEIGGETTLSWRVLNVKKCYIDDIGQVDTEGSMNVTIDSPKNFLLKAENDMGITDQTEKKVGCVKPSIQFSADSTWYHEGEEVTLRWEGTSAVSVQISPAPGEVPVSGSKKVVPHSPTFTATASGFDGFTPYAAMASLTLKKTPWKCEGTIAGVDLSKDTMNTGRRIWEYKGKSYVFCNRILYESEDVLHWQQTAKFELYDGMILKSCATTVVGDTFLVLGIKNKNSTFVQSATYDFSQRKWQITDALPDGDDTGGILSGIHDQPYYAHPEGPMVLFYTPEEMMGGKWNLVFYLKYPDVDACDISPLREYLYAGLHDGREHQLVIRRIKPKDRQWLDVGRLEVADDEWFCLVPTKGKLFLLTAEQMLCVDDLESVSPFHPELDKDYRPWTGSKNNMPFLVTKSGVLWCLKNYIKEGKDELP